MLILIQLFLLVNHNRKLVNRTLLFSNRYYRFLIATIMILLIIYLSTHVSFIFKPIVVFLQTVFIPVLIAGIFYYIFRPVVNFLHKYKIPKTLAILFIFVGFIGFVVGLSFLVGPILQKQMMNLIDNMPMLFNELRVKIIELQDSQWFAQFQESERFSIQELGENIYAVLMSSFEFVTKNITGLVGTITNTVLTIVLIPFILYYILKDGDKVPGKILGLFPKKQQIEGQKILKDMDTALSSYIQGQLLVSLCVGILIYIAYLILGVEYSLILALIAMVTNLIPFLGPWLGAIPAVIVAFISSPMLAFWVTIAIVVVQQIESNLISPQIVGKKLDIHPLTIIIIILVAGRFAGFIGFLIAVPTYAVMKVIVSHTYRLLQLRKKKEPVA